MKRPVLLCAALVLLTGCANSDWTRAGTEKTIQNDVYSYTGVLRPNMTYRGVVVQSRPVRIQPTGLNAAHIIGAITGGVAGYYLGGGEDWATAAGALVGAVITDTLNPADDIPGQELVVRLVDPNNPYAPEMVTTIVQGAAELLPANTEVFVVTDNDHYCPRARVIPFYPNPELDLNSRDLKVRMVPQAS